MGNRVYLVTHIEEGELPGEMLEMLSPFGKATEQQLKSCDRLVFDKRGKLLNRVRPADVLAMLEVERQLEWKRRQVILACGGAV